MGIIQLVYYYFNRFRYKYNNTDTNFITIDIEKNLKNNQSFLIK